MNTKIYLAKKEDIEKIDISVEKYLDKINEMLARDIKFSLSGDMLVKVDKYSMRHSLSESPLLDKDLVDYTFSIPGKSKIGFFFQERKF